jgi:hypothetical protein
MPIDYVVLDQGSLVYSHGYGVVAGADLVEHEQKLMADPHVARGFRQLLDCRWVAEEPLSDGLSDELADVHGQAKSKVNGARYAVVAHGSRWFSLGSQYQCDQYGMTMIVFNDPGTACIWLGADYRDLVQRWGIEVPLAAPIRQVGWIPAS